MTESPSPPDGSVSGGTASVGAARLWPLFLILAFGALIRVAYAIWADGMFHPDEIYQSLEPAHGVVYGVGIRSWEFVVGARPWSTPGVYALWLGGLTWLGLDSPSVYLPVIRVCNAVISATWPWFCYRIALALRTRTAGFVALVLSSSWYFLVLLAPRALNHTFSVTCALWAIARVLEAHSLDAPPRRRSIFFTGVLLGLAFAFRYQDGLLLAGLVLFLAVERRWKEVPLLLAGAAIPALGVGLLDGVMWGAPFHSLFSYLQANVLEGAAARFGDMPIWFYAWHVPAAFGLGAALFLLLPVAGRRALTLLGTVAGPVLVAHSLTANKQLRFVLPASLILMCVAACGVDTLVQRLPKRRNLLVLGGLFALWGVGMVHTARGLTFEHLGIFQGLPEAQSSPWSFRRDLNRALVWVGRRPDLCGVVLFPHGIAAGPARQSTTGGYSTLHRAAPLTLGPVTPETTPFTNYAVLCPDGLGHVVALSGFTPLGRVGGCVVAKRDGSGCDGAAAAAFMVQHTW